MTHTDYDRAYQQLFAEPEMIKDLLTGFIHEDWVTELDFSTLEIVKTDFITRRLRRRYSDVIWRLRFREQWLYLYVLLEFQSQVDRFMAVRIMTYLGLLYQHLAKQELWKTSKILPPGLPMVLYNGVSPWNAACDIADLIEPVSLTGLKPYLPQLKYWLLEERTVDESVPYQMKNLAAAIFRLEHSQTTDDIMAVLRHLVEWVAADEQDSLRQALVAWINEIPMQRLAPGHHINPAVTLLEAHTMLAETIDSWTRQWK